MLLRKRNLEVYIPCNDSNREALCGIRIEQDKTVSTNGSVLLQVPIKNDYTDDDFPVIDGIEGTPPDDITPFTLDYKTKDKILKLIPKQTAIPILRDFFLLEQNKERIKLGTTDLDNSIVIHGKTIDSEYPDYNAILPEDEPTLSVNISIQVLETLVKALKKMPEYNKNIAEPITFGFRGINKPITIQCRDITGIAMPCRQDDPKETEEKADNGNNI